MAKAKGSSAQFVICIRNEGYPASLEPRKIYQELPDRDASRAKLIRIIDESGEDYLFPGEFFIPLELSKDVEAALLRAS